MRRLVVAAVAAAMVAGVTREAEAQTWSFGQPVADRALWLQDRALLEGRGIRAGNFELHPGIGADVGYDSNVFYSSSSTNRVQPALRFRVAPTFYVSTLGPQRSTNSDSTSTALPTMNFRGGAGLIYHEWVGLQSGASFSGLRNLGAQGTLRFDFFPGRTWQFGLGTDFTRYIQPGPQDPSLFGGAGSTRTFNRNYIVGNAEVAYAPGRGIFEFRFGYNVYANLFDDITENNYLSNEGFARMRWRFLPRTALVWEGRVSRTSFLNASLGTTGRFDSTPMNTRFGLTGLITNRVSLLAVAGYHGTFYEYGDNADTVVGQAEVNWLIDGRSHLRGGFVRDVAPSFYGNFYIRNRGYVNYAQNFGGKFQLTADAGVGLYQYGYVAQTNGAPLPGDRVAGDFDPTTRRFNATRIDGTIFGEYRFNDVFGINVTLHGETLISAFKLVSRPAGGGSEELPIDWTRFDAYLGVRANW